MLNNSSVAQSVARPAVKLATSTGRSTVRFVRSKKLFLQTKLINIADPVRGRFFFGAILFIPFYVYVLLFYYRAVRYDEKNLPHQSKIHSSVARSLSS